MAWLERGVGRPVEEEGWGQPPWGRFKVGGKRFKVQGGRVLGLRRWLSPGL